MTTRNDPGRPDPATDTAADRGAAPSPLGTDAEAGGMPPAEAAQSASGYEPAQVVGSAVQRPLPLGWALLIALAIAIFVWMWLV
jgi:hypothetical protein